MRLGIMLGADPGVQDTVASILERAEQAQDAGFDDVWMAQIFGYDAINVLSLIASRCEHLGIGTAVTPSFPRHPSALAQQVITAQEVSSGRFTLGLGLSHKMVIEDMMGFSYDKPARHMREYLNALMPLLSGEAASQNGDQYRVNMQLSVANEDRATVLLAALGPVMLKLAGSVADGTSTWMTGPSTLENHIMPALTSAAQEAGRVSPKICAGFPIALTSDVDAAKAYIAENLSIYGHLPSYRAMLDKEGAEGPADIAMVGDETSLRNQLQRLRTIGVTHFNAAIVAQDDASYQRTRDFLASERSSLQ